MRARRATPDLETLVDLFYDNLRDLGEFTEVDEAEMPEVDRGLLAHDEHMTVAVEAFHGCPVDVRVLEVHTTPIHYSRKILLTRQSDGAVVQYGIVRLNLDYLGADVRREIESQQTPLGRILIEHNVLRTVRLLTLWKIEPGEELRKLFGLQRPGSPVEAVDGVPGAAGTDAEAESGKGTLPAASTCYGRTALIYCNGIPAVELLEIVTPAA